ncbi:uncharacterized protein LOC133199041 [Saccostrea echinata]|uniref:uncharacterized protein LOC133199041 n=1 Tax=Saccostrea echinata TaxID=191078 RepID=UPI002A807CB7|nr:uncharacterized protein LOC133199041 [Saccostrea echinata]
MSENITTLTGVLVDVSGSMRWNVGEGVNEGGGDWVRSIFQVIDDLIKHDISETNEVFAIAYGANNCKNEIFDILSTLKRFQIPVPRYESFRQIIDRLLQILHNAGASSVRKWATIDVIKNAISHNLAAAILRELESDRNFVRFCVDKCLPPACKGYTPVALSGYDIFSLFAKGVIGTAESVASTVRPATKADVTEAVGKAMGFLLNDVSISSSIFSVQEASNIIHGSVGEELTENRLQELMDTVKPIIYGLTPFYTSLRKAKELFSSTRYRNHKKLLFIFSDGVPTDQGNEKMFGELRDENVVVVSCFITRSTAVESQRLYSKIEREWDNGAKLMFKLSSKVPTQLLPRTIFVKRGWKIDIKNNETKLFLQANHPDIMRDACSLARNVVCCQDALADILVSVSLDIYINQSTTGFGAQRQVGGTCYANASAAVLHLSMKRILGREGGYPDFLELRQDLIDLYGIEGANTLAVLQNVCPKYRLHCKKVDIIGAMHAITAKRPVVARFRLTDAEWKVFSKFYEEHKTGVLTRNEIDLRKSRYGKLGGHAVVLTSFNSECLYLMNSWGTEWGDNGFFRVQNADVLDLEFIDVFWTLNDLTENEKDYHKRHGSEVADKLMKSLISLQRAKYLCPVCNQTSLVTEFSGHLTQAKCPKCYCFFNSNEAGNILALNMYLTSISR